MFFCLVAKVNLVNMYVWMFVFSSPKAFQPQPHQP